MSKGTAFDIPRFVPESKANDAQQAAAKPSLADAPSSIFDMGRRIAAELDQEASDPPTASPATKAWGPQEQTDFIRRQVARADAPTVIVSKTPLFALRSDNSLSLHLDGWEGPSVVLTPDITRALFQFLDRMQGLKAEKAT